MSNFIYGIILLILGYFFYGRLVERILCPDDRPTPATTMNDGVDYLVLPKWKNMLIQLLNIAGVGPVIGVILGIKFGAIVFLIIPTGCIIGGAVHDMVAGFMSMRYQGANLTHLVQLFTSKKFTLAFSIFLCAILLLVVTVFITTPAQLIEGQYDNLMKQNEISQVETSQQTNISNEKTQTDLQIQQINASTQTPAAKAPKDYSSLVFWGAVALIFIYYIISTLFSIDAIIGKFYPIFGLLLLVGTVALFVTLLIIGHHDPSLFLESEEFKANLLTTGATPQPIIPCLFVTIACGILSGFHATQSPIVARTMKSEKEACATFYGMMIVEGIIAMIWAGAGLAIYNKFPNLMSKPPAFVLNEITTFFLGKNLGAVTVVSVIILSITSGDTALRSLRLSLAELLNIKQIEISKRLMITLPLAGIVCLCLWWANSSEESFRHCWNYFAWANQVLAAVTLTICTAWLIFERKMALITFIPGVFITFVVTTYICWVSPSHGGPLGLGMDLTTAMICAVLVTTCSYVWAITRGIELRHKRHLLLSQKKS